MTASAFAPRPRPRRTTLLLVLGALTVSVAGATMVLGSFGYRSATTERIPVAVVNLDQPTTTADGATVAAGRQLAADLVAPETATVLGWSLTDEASAASGFDDGTYDAVVTIPDGFSRSVVSLADDAPFAALLTLETNDAASPVAGLMSDQVVAATATAFGTDVTVQYLDSTYQAIDQIGQGLTKSASGASDLADGAQQLAASTSDLADGAGSLAASASQLSGGTSSLASATSSLAGGAASTSDGASDLAAGAVQLTAAATALAAGTTQLAQGASSLAEATQQTASSIAALYAGSASLASANAALATGATGLAASCPPTAGAAYCAQLASLANQAQGTAYDAGALSAGLAAASSGAQQLLAGSSSLAASASETKSGATDLASAAATTSQGAASLAAGADDVATGAAQVASASAQVNDGATGLTSAAADLARGAGGFSDGAQGLATSSQTLASGLSDAAHAVPDYSDQAARTTLAATVAAPVQVTTSVANPVGPDRPAAAAVAVVLALWLGAVTIGLMRPAMPRWALAAPADSLRGALLGLAPFAAVALAEALAFAALAPLAGVDLASPAAFTALVLAGGLATGAVHQAILALSPHRGQVIALLAGLLQLVSLAVLLPAQTAPAVIQWLAEVLPLPALAQGVNQAVVGGSVVPAGATALAMLTWTVAALAATTAATRRATTRLPARASAAAVAA